MKVFRNLLAIVLVAASANWAFSQDKPSAMSEEWLLNYLNEKLGKAGVDCVQSPDSFTLHRVIPAIEEGTDDRTVGRVRVKPIDRPRLLPKSSWSEAGRYVLKSLPEVFGNRCTFRPDHLLEFKRGETVVCVLTCRGCNLAIVELNRKPVGLYIIDNEFDLWLGENDFLDTEQSALLQEQLSNEVMAAMDVADNGRWQPLTLVENQVQAGEWKDLTTTELALARELVLATVVASKSRLYAREAKRLGQGWRLSLGSKVVIECSPHWSRDLLVTLTGKEPRTINSTYFFRRARHVLPFLWEHPKS